MTINRMNVDSHGTTVECELFRPSASANGAAIIIAHGFAGMTQPWAEMIREYAASLADKGFTTFIPNYFQKTGATPGLHVFSEPPWKLQSWVEAVSDTVAYARALPGASISRVGLLGFSLGGHISLRLRASAQALVEFFAPELRPFGGLGPAQGTLPKVQIHHGRADPLVPFADAQAIADTLRHEGAALEIFSYEGAGHGFAGTDPHNATARRSSKERTLEFFERSL